MMAAGTLPTLSIASCTQRVGSRVYTKVHKRDGSAVYSYEETLSLLAHLGYTEHTKGSTSGSRVRFKNEQTGAYIDIHRPHPGSIMKEWMVKTIYQHLKSHKLIK